MILYLLLERITRVDLPFVVPKLICGEVFL